MLGISRSDSFASEILDPLPGTWVGPAVYQGESADLVFHFREEADGRVSANFELPLTNVKGPVGNVRVEGDKLMMAIFEFEISESGSELQGIMKFGGKDIPFHMKKDAPVPELSRRGEPVRLATPVWTFDTEGAVWSSPVVADGVVYFGSNDGNVYALKSASGEFVWKFLTQGAVVSPPMVSGHMVYVLSDDGRLYCLDAKSGDPIWEFDTGGGAVKRAWPGRTEFAYDYSGSAARISNGRVFVGGADGRMFAIDATTGKLHWQFKTNDIVRSTPLIAEGLVFFGSRDHFVYALDEKSGSLKWKFDTKEPVVSSPAYQDGKIFIGSRSSDIYAINAATGKPIWNYFYWMSWVESSGTIRDDVMYIGSSDYQLVFALSTETGKPIWTYDTDGSAWSTPAITQDAVYFGSVGTVGYMADHRGGMFAVRRSDGKELWRYEAEEISGTYVYGFASSPTVAGGLVLIGGLDGKLYAFPK